MASKRGRRRGRDEPFEKNERVGGEAVGDGFDDWKR
jgi:hypothetical protein